MPLFQRSFPKALVGQYEDRTLIDKDGNKALRFMAFPGEPGEPDYWTPMGSALRMFRRNLSDFPHELSSPPIRSGSRNTARRSTISVPASRSASAGAR